MSHRKKWSYLLVPLVLVGIILLYVGARYQKARRRALLTMRLEDALGSDEPRAIRLLRMGAYANAKSQDGSPLIFDSLNSGDVSLLKAFIAAGADVNAQFPPSEGQRMTLLGEAGKMSEDINPHQLEQMKCLLNAGADPNRGSQSILAVCTGGCAEGCWSNPREVHLLLQHGAKLRKGDAAAILNAALDDDDLELLDIWLTLPVSPQEQRAMLNAGTLRVRTYNPGCEDKEDRSATIAFLQHELRKMKNGSRSPKSR